MDSADGKFIRVMKIDSIYSGSFNSGSSFAENKGMDMAMLPMNPTANGYAIDTSLSGSYISFSSGNNWCLMAFGMFEPWKPKIPKKITNE